MNFNNLKPVLENGILPVTLGSLIYTSRSTEILGLAMLLPYLNNRQKAKAVFIFSFALVSLFFILITIPVITTSKFSEIKSLTFPYYNAVRLISVGDIIERIESMHMAIWILGAFVKVTLYYYLVVLGLGQVFRLKDYKPLILPTGTIIVSLSAMLGRSIVETREFTSFEIYTWYTLFFILLIPSLLLLTAILRKKGGPSR